MTPRTNASVTLADNRIAGDVLSISNSGASFADKNAGANKTVTVNGIALSGTDAGNYTVNATATTTASITQAALGVKVDNAEKDQGLVNPAFTASYTGLLGNDTLANEVSGNLAFSTPASIGYAIGQLSGVGCRPDVDQLCVDIHAGRADRQADRSAAKRGGQRDRGGQCGAIARQYGAGRSGGERRNRYQQGRRGAGGGARAVSRSRAARRWCWRRHR